LLNGEDMKSRMRGESQVRFRGSPRGKFPRAVVGAVSVGFWTDILIQGFREEQGLGVVVAGDVRYAGF
jgi:hypothetical protein